MTTNQAANRVPKVRAGRTQAANDAKVNLNFTIDCSKPV